MKKYIALIVALCIVIVALALISKNDTPPVPTTESSAETTVEEETTSAVKENEIVLGYYEEKSLNPYLTDSPANRNLSTLIYDGLYILDEKYSPEPVIAQSSERQENRLTVYLNPDLYFSSGSPLTASDVVYSFNIAKESAYYSSRLSAFTGAVSGTDSVVFTLAKENDYIESCLTFPIVQAGTAQNDIPVGSGRYVLQSDAEGKFLLANENPTRNETMDTSKIRLTPISSEANELYMLQSGDLSYFFDDLSDGQYTKISANMLRVPLNNLVFLGVNSNSEVMTDINLRKAISQAIDKVTIAEAAYSGMCRAAETPFNPDWYALSAFKAEKESYSAHKAAQILESAGYVYAYKNNDFRSKNFEFLNLTMIVNEESEAKVSCAKLIHDSLETLGIEITLKILPFEDYAEDLYDGKFDIYLGEVKLPASMDLSCFFEEGGAAGYGINSNSTVATAYSDFSRGKVDISTFVKVFSRELPFIPLCYRDGIAYYSREISFESSVTEYEPFLNAYSWEIVSAAQ